MSYPRETKEFQPIGVKQRINGVATKVTSDVEIALLPSNVRPTPDVAWEVPMLLDGDIGVLLEGRDKGTLLIWARVTSLPEVPIIYCGSVTLS